MKGISRVLLASLILLLIFAATLWSGTTGKITGVVIDEGNKEPLPGATVQIVGTKLGAITKDNGFYVILNVPPGSYDLKVSFIGYQEVLMQQVKISADITTTVDSKMKATAVELPTEIIRAERQMIERSVTGNLRRIDSEAIQNMTVKTVDELLATQVGFITHNGELHVRGGRANEVLYVVDGVATRDPLGGLGAVRGGMNVPSSDVEEVSILKGGFDAEYGNATSGIINIVTKEGNNISTKGSIEYLTDDFGDRKLNKYSFNTDRLTLNFNGPDPFISRHLLPALGINFVGDKLSYAASFDVFKSDGYVNINQYAPPDARKQFRYDDLFSITIPDLLDYKSGIKIPERMNNMYNGSLKLTYKATPTRKLIFSYRKSVNNYTTYFNPTYETRGDIDVWSYRYTPSTLPVVNQSDVSMSLSYSENIGRNSLVEMQLSRFVKRYQQLPGSPTERGGVVYPDQFIFSGEWESQSVSQDANDNGQWDAAEPFVDVNSNDRYDLGEPFQDTNKGKNGVWDPGEYYVDANGDGIYDPDSGDVFDARLYDSFGEGKWDDAEAFTDTPIDLNRDGDTDDPGEAANGILDQWKLPTARGAEGVDEAEPWIDGDIDLGEPFLDVDNDGVYNDTVDFFITCACPGNNDLNFNGQYDGPNDLWSAGVPYIDNNKNGRYDAPNGRWDPGEPYTDKNGNGQYDTRDGFYDRGNERRTYYQERESEIWTLKGSFTSQVRREHEVKTGFEFTYNTLSYSDIRYPYLPYNGDFTDNGIAQGHGAFRDVYTRYPTQGAFFVQDKLEYGTMTAKLGVRYDFYLQDRKLRLIAESNEGSDKSEEGFVQNLTKERIVNGRNKVSPRLGFAYPVSDVAKVYFNYAHYYQLPELHFVFSRATQASNAAGIVGNYNLDFTKNIHYELGIQYVMSDAYLLDVSGYFKDQFGLVNTVKVNYQGREWDFYDNVDYGRSRGMEIQLDKKRGHYVNGYVNYQYAYAYGKNSAEVSNYYASFSLGGEQFIPLKEYPLDWDVRHQLTFNLDLRFPRGDRPRLFGMRVPDAWGINLLWQYSSGKPFTPDRTFPGIGRLAQGRQIPNNYERMPSTAVVDLRFNKDFSVWKTDYTFTILVHNLFDKKNVATVYSNTGRADTSQNSGGIVTPGVEKNRNPLNYGAGRNIQLGLSMSF